MPQLSKKVIWDRIRVKDVWLLPAGPGVLPVRTPFWVAAEEHMQAVPNLLAQRYMRYVLSMLFQGNEGQNDSTAAIELLETNGTTYTMKWSNIVVEAGEFPRQIPEGAYGVEDPIIAVAGGQNLYGRVNGNSINLTVTYFDNDI